MSTSAGTNLRMLSRTSRPALRPLRTYRISHRVPAIASTLAQPAQRSFTPRRTFHASLTSRKGILPHSSEPEPPNPEKDVATGGAHHVSEPAEISEDEYHEIADHYIDELVAELEEMAEDVGSGLEVEYSAGVLTLGSPHGTYVLNKQPPNKQIWLSSPLSGPKRYDWVLGGGDHQHLKEGTATDANGDLRGGMWVYLRDSSTLTELLKKEVGINLEKLPEKGNIGDDGTYK